MNETIWFWNRERVQNFCCGETLESPDYYSISFAKCVAKHCIDDDDGGSEDNDDDEDDDIEDDFGDDNGNYDFDNDMAIIKLKCLQEDFINAQAFVLIFKLEA